MSHRIAGTLILASLAWRSAAAAGAVLDGAPVSLNKAQNWCISPSGPIPNWDAPAHPECAMVWRVLAERDGRTLYSARYAWPSPRGSRQPLRVLTEVLVEGIPGGRVVRKLYAIQEDEAHVRLAPLRMLTVGGATIIESRVCVIETGECGRELAEWTADGIQTVEDHTVAEIRSKLPPGYDIRMNPAIDLGSLSGSGKVWAKKDADCCPSAAMTFTLHLDGRELHLGEVTLTRGPA